MSSIDTFARSMTVLAIQDMLPLTHLAPKVVIKCMYSCYFLLNSSPVHDGGINYHESSRNHDSTQLKDQKHCQINFREYMQPRQAHDNMMLLYTTGAISMEPTDNHHGGQCFN